MFDFKLLTLLKVPCVDVYFQPDWWSWVTHYSSTRQGLCWCPRVSLVWCENLRSSTNPERRVRGTWIVELNESVHHCEAYPIDDLSWRTGVLTFFPFFSFFENCLHEFFKINDGYWNIMLRLSGLVALMAEFPTLMHNRLPALLVAVNLNFLCVHRKGTLKNCSWGRLGSPFRSGWCKKNAACASKSNLERETSKSSLQHALLPSFSLRA